MLIAVDPPGEGGRPVDGEDGEPLDSDDEDMEYVKKVSY